MGKSQSRINPPQRRCKLCNIQMGRTNDRICEKCLLSNMTICPCGCGLPMIKYNKIGTLRKGIDKSHATRAIRSSPSYGDEWKRKIWENRDRDYWSSDKRIKYGNRISELYKDPNSKFNSLEVRNSRSKNAKQMWETGKLKSPNEATRAKLSESLKESYTTGKRKPSHSYGKRTKIITPHGAKNLKSSWELAVSKILDLNFTDWYYESTTFNLGDTTYTPDFYIPILDLYLEIKGYETESFKYKYKKMLEIHDSVNIIKLSGKNIRELVANAESALREYSSGI